MPRNITQALLEAERGLPSDGSTRADDAESIRSFNSARTHQSSESERGSTGSPVQTPQGDGEGHELQPVASAASLQTADMARRPSSPSIRQFVPPGTGGAGSSSAAEASSAGGAAPGGLAHRPPRRVSFAESTTSRPHSRQSVASSTSEEAVEEITEAWTPDQMAGSVETVAEAVESTASVLPHDQAVAAARTAFSHALQPVPIAQQTLNAAQVAADAAQASATRRGGVARVPPMVATQKQALLQMGQNALVLGARHFGVVFTSLLSAHAMAKGFEPLLGARSEKMQTLVNRVLTGGSITLTLGGLAWPRLSSGSAERPNAATDFGRLVMASGTAMSFLGAYLSETENQAARGNARLAVFTPIRDLLLHMISYSTNRDPANPDRLRPLISPNVTYGVMQFFAGLATSSPHIFSGASTAAESATWSEALRAFGKLSAVYAAPEAINLVLTEMVNVSADKIAPSESANLSDEEIRARNRDPQTRSWTEAQAQSSVNIDLNGPTFVGLGNQFFGPAANNTAYFMMAINLTGLLSKAVTKIKNPEHNLVVQSLIDAVLYSAFYVPFAMATNQNPSDIFKYGPGNPLANTVAKDDDEQEGVAGSAT